MIQEKIEFSSAIEGFQALIKLSIDVAKLHIFLMKVLFSYEL